MRRQTIDIDDEDVDAPVRESKLTAVQRENKRLQEEIQRVMIANTRLQREIMTLNGSRELIIADGHDRVAELTEELKHVDAELASVRSDCDHIISVICHHKENANLRSLGDLATDLGAMTIEEEDIYSDHSTASTASSSSSHSSSSRNGGDSGAGRKSSRADMGVSRGRPPLSKKLSIDIDDVPKLARSTSAIPSASAHAPLPSASARDTLMGRISRSVKKAQSMPQMSPDRVSVQSNPNHSPMLAYKANSVVRATQTHLNNFRRHSGPYRRNLDTVVL